MATEEERQEEGEAPPHPGLEPFCREESTCVCVWGGGAHMLLFKKKPHSLSAAQADLKLVGSSGPPNSANRAAGT